MGRVFFPSGAVELEGVLDLPDAGGPVAGAVLCHPHPEYGGTLDNHVVTGLAEAFLGAGFAVLRFNFRGVGRSGGTHGGGGPERGDVAAALSFLAGSAPVDPTALVLAGYSFGAWVGLPVGAASAGVRALVAVAPPLAAFPMEAFDTRGHALLAVAGTRDPFCPADRFDAWFASLSEPKEKVVVEGADHFFRFREAEVGRAAAGFARRALQLPA
ncbi:MAG: alpha/beta hydrolase [Deferrisomatales bacterium]